MNDRVEPSPEIQEALAARAYRALERLVVTLELVPGSLTTERALIERLSLGRTPVREALQRLAWEGLVSVKPRAGLEIAPLRPDEWIKVLDARRGVEVVLARAAATADRRTVEEEFQAAAMAMHGSVVANDVYGFLDADKALDDIVARAAQNPYASRLAAPLQTHSRRFWFRFQSGTGLAEAAAQHVALIKAILSGDEEEAAAEADMLMALLRLHAQAAAMR